MGIKRIRKIRDEEIRARAGVANICEKPGKMILGRIGHVERKTEEGVVMGAWKMKEGGHRHYRKPKPRWSDVIRKDMNDK